MSTVNKRKTTKIILFPKIGGKRMPFAESKTNTSRNLIGYSLILHDLKQAKGFLEKCIELDQPNKPPDIVREALWKSFIVTYMKCFTRANERKVKLDISSILKKEFKKYYEVHNSIAELRHKFISHSDGKNHESGTVQVILNDNITEKKILKVVLVGLSAASENKQIYEQYLALLEIVINYVNEKINKTFSVAEKEAKNRPIEEWYKVALFPN